MSEKALQIIWTLFFIVFVSCSLKAQLRVDGQMRSRLEYRNGYQKLAASGSVPSVFVSQRTRLTLNYEMPGLKFQITPQDVRVWGDQTVWNSSGVGDNPSFALFEGYAEIGLGNTGWLSVGRQQLIYDKEFIFATRNWNQNGIVYDAAVLKLNLNKWNFHAGSSWNTMTERNSDNFYPADRIKTVNFLWLNRKISQPVTFSLMQVASGVTKSDTDNKLLFRHTSSVFAEYVDNELNVWGNLHYQTGKNNLGQTVSAYLFSSEISYKPGALTPGAGVILLSGNKNIPGEGKTDHLFDILYGARHRYYGNIDYFRSFSVHTAQGGLNDYFAYIDFNISKKVQLKNSAHYFQLNQSNELTPNNKNLGFENDLVVKYKFREWGTLETGALFFSPPKPWKPSKMCRIRSFQTLFIAS